jgi:signal transduction histidine kinase
MAEMAASAPDVRSLPNSKQPRNPISRKQVEAVISRSVAVFGIVFGAQTIPWLLGQLDEAYPVWIYIMVPATFGTLLVALVASIISRWVRPAHALVSLVYLIALVSWPFAVSTEEVFDGPHWLYYLLTVATATAAIAFSTFWATVYLFAVPVVYFIGRIMDNGGAAPPLLAVLETVYAIILGSAVMIIVTMLRQAAASVDTAQATALERYSHAVRQHATEFERVQVDSIVHDSVLTTLISAARAYSPEAQELAATMAGNAIGHLQAAALVSPDDENLVRLSTVSERIVEAAAGMTERFEVTATSVGTRSMPSQAAEAMVSAAIQAMVNSLQHGGSGATRWVKIRGLAPGCMEVAVGDDGEGFDLAAVPSERLGVRVSILERVAGAGGIAEIDSAPGEGTIVTMRWPDGSASS